MNCKCGGQTESECCFAVGLCSSSPDNLQIPCCERDSDSGEFRAFLLFLATGDAESAKFSSLCRWRAAPAAHATCFFCEKNRNVVAVSLCASRGVSAGQVDVMTSWVADVEKSVSAGIDRSRCTDHSGVAPTQFLVKPDFWGKGGRSGATRVVVYGRRRAAQRGLEH